MGSGSGSSSGSGSGSGSNGHESLKKKFLCHLFISVSATIVTTLQKTERKKPFVNKAEKLFLLTRSRSWIKLSSTTLVAKVWKPPFLLQTSSPSYKGETLAVKGLTIRTYLPTSLILTLLLYCTSQEEGKDRQLWAKLIFKFKFLNMQYHTYQFVWWSWTINWKKFQNYIAKVINFKKYTGQQSWLLVDVFWVIVLAHINKLVWGEGVLAFL